MKLKKFKLNKKMSRILFMVVMLLIPVSQFVVFWVYVNIDMIFMTFQKFSWTTGDYAFIGFSNYQRVFEDIFTDPLVQRRLFNSFLYMPISCFVILPLSMLFSYWLYKRVPLAGFFRIIYFLPSILPIAVLTMVYAFMFDSTLGPIYSVIRFLQNFFDPGSVGLTFFGQYPNNQIMILLYCVWVGLGFNIILLNGAITRIPHELIEVGQMEGISLTREFFQVVVPLIWPTITTTFVLGVASIFTVMLQPLMLTPTSPDTSTISLIIYQMVLRDENLPEMATFGLVVSLLGMPLILLIRKTMTSLFKDVDY
ncbi:MAG: sugar ABC transporter permease [Bacilli bacterium]|jgi:ABC-type sugar transport system permease subunit